MSHRAALPGDGADFQGGSTHVADRVVPALGRGPGLLPCGPLHRAAELS